MAALQVPNQQRRVTFTRAGEERREVRTVGSVAPWKEAGCRQRESRWLTQPTSSARRQSRAGPAALRLDRRTCRGVRNRGRGWNLSAPPLRASGRDRDASAGKRCRPPASGSAERPPARGQCGRLKLTDAPGSRPSGRASKATSPGRGSRRPTEDAGADEIRPLIWEQISQLDALAQTNRYAQSMPPAVARKHAKNWDGTARRA